MSIAIGSAIKVNRENVAGVRIPREHILPVSIRCRILNGNPNRPGTRRLGGGERDRTDDLLRARQALSQLSYTPEKTAQKWWAWMDLNHRPHAYQACALTKLSYRPRVFRILDNGLRIRYP